MKSAAFQYAKAKDLPGALDALGEAEGGVKLLGGGQSLLPMMNLRLAWAEQLLDISELETLKQRERRGTRYFIGGGVTHAALEDGVADDLTQGYVPTVAAGIAYRSVRNKGTIGGSVVHADPAADWPTALRALDTRVLIQGRQDQRQLPLAEFQVGLMETALEADEIVLGFELPVLSERARWAYKKFNRKTGEFGHALCAAVRDPAQSWACVMLGAVVDTPQRLPALSEWLLKASAADVQRTATLDALIQDDLGQVLDQAPDSYEFHLAATLIRRALREVVSS